MITSTRYSSRLVMSVLVLVILVAGGCKSKKKAMEAQNAAEKARMEQEAKSKREREDEARRKADEEERARRDAAANAQPEKTEPYSKLEQYFSAVSSTGNVSAANSSIAEALALFASDQTPVLIVISEENGQKDYDRPTTIKDYLNYLKDQKKNVNKIEKLQFDQAGKITEVELSKKK